MHFGHQIKDRLVARRRALLDRYLDELVRVDEQLQAADLDPVGNAADRYDAHILQMLGDSDAHAVRDLTSAIQRFDSGGYGTCVKCSRDIGARRLEALPAVALCIGCASRAENAKPRA